MNAISWRRVGLGLWLALFPLFIVMALSPVGSRRSRLGMVVVLAAIIVGGLVLNWKRRGVFLSLAGALGILAIFLLLPGRPASPALRDYYVEALASYEGAPYVWGGESPRGIDCSGLPRRSLQEALLKEGMLTLNPDLVRAAIELWWSDTTAQNMGLGYAGRIYPVTACSSLNELNHSLLQPGDMAVTDSGIHIMAYLGNQKWIEADPSDLKVMVFTVPESKNAWFATPMKIVRWSRFRDSRN